MSFSYTIQAFRPLGEFSKLTEREVTTASEDAFMCDSS